MKNINLKRFYFGSEKLENNISNFYSELYNKETNKIMNLTSNTESNFLKNGFFLIEDIPNYLATKPAQSVDKIKTINKYSGSLINLVNYNTPDAYLKNGISKRRIDDFNRRLRRLDLCFRPTYKMYYGSISQDEYDIIFRDYKHMLLRRLEEKKAYWEELDYWEERYKTSYERIINKEACIFVIYNKEVPISIYISTVFETILFAEVIAYDIDYSKFHLGYITLIKLVEWGIVNNFDLIDLSKGEFDYKKSFRNGAYVFQNHIIYDSSNFQILIKVNLLMLKLNIFYKLLPKIKGWKIYHIYKEYKRSKKKNLFNGIDSQHNAIIIKKNYTIDSEEVLKRVNLDDDKYTFLKKDLIDFIFLENEYYEDVLAYNVENTKNTYIFKGTNSVQKIVFNS